MANIGFLQCAHVNRLRFSMLVSMLAIEARNSFFIEKH